MDDIKKIIKRQEIGALATETLIAIAEKSKFAVLAEKFLTLSFEKNKTILRGLEEQRKHNKLFWIAFSSVPLAVLLPFFVQDTVFLDLIVKNEMYCRLFVGSSIGFIICTYLVLSISLSKALLIVPIITYVVYRIPTEEFFSVLLGTSNKRFAFLLLATGHGVVPIARAYAGLWQGFKDLLRLLFKGKKSRTEKDLQSLLQSALNESAGVKKKELANLVQEYHPEYAQILDHLKDPSEESHAALTTPVFEPPQLDKNAIMPLHVGQTKEGVSYDIDLATLPHMIVGGSPGGGKSNFLRHIIATFSGQDSVDIMIIDQQQVDFVPYHNPPSLQVFNGSQAMHVMHRLMDEIELRQKLFLKKGIVQLSEWVDNNKPHRIILIIDEYSQLCDDKEFTKSLRSIAEVGRKWGIHLIVGTQHPSAKVISTEIKNCIPEIMAFRAATKEAARVMKAPNAWRISRLQKGLGYFVEADVPTLVQTPLAKVVNQSAIPALSGIPGGKPAKRALVPENEDFANGIPEKYSQKEAKMRVLSGGIPPGSLVSSCIPLYQPARQGDDGAQFLTHEELASKLRDNPKDLGFEQKRRWVDGSFRRGYWMKVSHQNHNV